MNTHFTIEKRPMQQHIGGSSDTIFYSRDKALNRFFEMTDAEGYEITQSFHGNVVTYEAGGRGHDYRITLEITNIN